MSAVRKASNKEDIHTNCYLVGVLYQTNLFRLVQCM